MIKKIAISIVALLALGAIGITLFVEAEADFRHEVLEAKGAPKALILYHPSRDAGFSEELSGAVARGFTKAGFAVDRETMTSKTPAKPEGYAVVAVVSNTFWSMPDLPTLRYLDRARFEGSSVIGLIGGAGSTDHSQDKLKEALKKTGASSIKTRSFWISRPNDEKQMNKPNRQVARQMATAFAYETARAVTQNRQETE
jgi:hypothetical protein